MGSPGLFHERPGAVDSSRRGASLVWFLARAAAASDRAATEAGRKVRDGDARVARGREDRAEGYSKAGSRGCSAESEFGESHGSCQTSREAQFGLRLPDECRESQRVLDRRARV